MNIYDIWFSRIEISNSIKLRLLEEFDILEIFKFSKDELLELGLKETTANIIICDKYRKNLEKYDVFLKNNLIKLISFKDKNYPWRLKHIPDMPAYIFVKGNSDILDDESIAIVGSRTCTEYGRKVAYSVAKELGDNNINVVSGLAIGIDTASHKGSLNSKYGKTVAVVANGLLDSDIYPKENLSLSKTIIDKGGAIVSEHIIGTKSKKYYFPTRNRIVSGLANKILVVEASEKSGTLITVRAWIRARKRYFCGARKYR